MPKKYHGYTLTKDRKGGGFSTVEDPKIKGTTIQEVKRAIDLKIGSPSSDPTTFLINAWKFFKNNIDRNAPDEIREAFNGSSLRVPEGDDDTMLAPFKMMAHVCPPSLLSPDIFAQKDDVATRAKTGVLLCLPSHPKWRHVRLLFEVLGSNEQMTKFKKEKREDYLHWMFLLFGITTLVTDPQIRSLAPWPTPNSSPRIVPSAPGRAPRRSA